MNIKSFVEKYNYTQNQRVCSLCKHERIGYHARLHYCTNPVHDATEEDGRILVPVSASGCCNLFE